MGKYDVHIDMRNRRSSHTLILEQIDPCSMVLEFGCAAGYMTKFMRDFLNCKVHILEVDKESFDYASQFSFGGICCDIETYAWEDRFKHKAYDYVLFADVLEHLKDPLTVLTRSVDMLKDDGRVIISIPNICHNDIIIQLFYDHFRYTDWGLLDNTHIRFWGREDFIEMINKAGLKVTDIRTVNFSTQGTEQHCKFRVDDELMNLLKRREYGEVYQWVFTCEKR